MERTVGSEKTTEELEERLGRVELMLDLDKLGGGGGNSPLINQTVKRTEKKLLEEIDGLKARVKVLELQLSTKKKGKRKL